MATEIINEWQKALTVSQKAYDDLESASARFIASMDNFSGKSLVEALYAEWCTARQSQQELDLAKQRLLHLERIGRNWRSLETRLSGECCDALLTAECRYCDFCPDRAPSNMICDVSLLGYRTMSRDTLQSSSRVYYASCTSCLADFRKRWHALRLIYFAHYMAPFGAALPLIETHVPCRVVVERIIARYCTGR